MRPSLVGESCVTSTRRVLREKKWVAAKRVLKCIPEGIVSPTWPKKSTMAECPAGTTTIGSEIKIKMTRAAAATAAWVVYHEDPDRDR
jgi:hypothetical protein